MQASTLANVVFAKSQQRTAKLQTSAQGHSRCRCSMTEIPRTSAFAPKATELLLRREMMRWASSWGAAYREHPPARPCPSASACALNEPPRSRQSAACHYADDRVAARARIRGHRCTRQCAHVPTLCPLAVSPFNFSRSMELIERAEHLSRKWIDEGGLSRSARPEELAPHRH